MRICFESWELNNKSFFSRTNYYISGLFLKIFTYLKKVCDYSKLKKQLVITKQSENLA